MSEQLITMKTIKLFPIGNGYNPWVVRAKLISATETGIRVRVLDTDKVRFYPHTSYMYYEWE